MASGLPLPVHNHCLQYSRFTEEDGWILCDLSLSSCGNIAVTGYNQNTHRTSIDVYSPVRNFEFRVKPKAFHSKEFEKYVSEGRRYNHRLVSSVDAFDDKRGLVVATGLGDKLEVFDFNQDRVLKFRKVTLLNHGYINCLSPRGREIFTCFFESNKITVYDVSDLNEIKAITLQGIQETEHPLEMTVFAGRMFIVTNNYNTETDKSLIVKESNGEFLSELTYSCESPRYVHSITVCAALGVIALLWADSFWIANSSHFQIVFYSLASQNNSSFLTVEVEFGVSRIRISDRGDKMVTRNYVTREVKVYDMAKIFTYNQLKTSLTSQLQTDDCLRLADFFALPKDQTDSTLKSEKPTENFLIVLEETGLLQPANVDRLADAFTELAISSSCYNLADFYQNTRTSAFSKETIQKLHEEINVLQVQKQEITERLEAANNRAEAQVQTLQKTLEETGKHLQETNNRHQKTVCDQNTLRAERDKYHLQLSSLRRDLESSKKLQQQTEKSLLQTKELLEKAAQENKTQVQTLQKTLEGTEKRLQETNDRHQKTVCDQNTLRAERDEYHLQLSNLKGELDTFKKLQQQTEKSLLQTKELLEKATQEKRAIKAEMEQYKPHSSRKTRTHGEVATEGHFIETRQKKRSRLMREERNSGTSSRRKYFRESAIGRNFSQLIVDLQLELSKDHCVVLATYFTFPKSKIDLIQSDNGTPALTLLSEMKDLGIVNMYDVTNLQKGLDYVKLSGINETFVKPYQKRIHPSLYEQNKVTR